MASLDYDSHANKQVQRRGPANPTVESPRNPGEQGAVGAGALALASPPLPPPAGIPSASGSYMSAGRLQVLHTLNALAGPPSRQPLVYTGDATASLAALRTDIAASYSMLCGALGEPERMDLVGGSLPAAAALGIHLPSSGVAAKLPSIYGRSGSPPPAAPPLLLEGPGRASSPGSLAFATEGDGGVAMGLGQAVGIEGVGSGVSAPAKLLSAGAGAGQGAGSAHGGQLGPYALQSFSGLAHRGAGGLLQQPSPAVAGLPPLPLPGSGQNWPVVRQGGGVPSVVGGRTSGSGGPDGARVGMLTGLSRPKDPDSEFLGEESALVFPPPGRSFGGGPSLLGAAAGGSAAGGFIDPMDDLRYRGGSRKHAVIEQLDPVSKLGRRHGGDGQDLERFLQDFARDRSKPDNGESNNRYRMPF